MQIKKKGRKRTNEAAFEKIREAGRETVVILAREWKLVTPPGAYILRKYLGREYKVNTLVGDKGWAIKRV